MALGTLFVWFIVMGIAVIAGTVLLFAIKNRKANDVILILMTAAGICIAFMSATAQPSNYIAAQVIAWAIGLIAVIGAGVRLFSKKQSMLSKLLVAASAIAGIIYLYFG